MDSSRLTRRLLHTPRHFARITRTSVRSAGSERGRPRATRREWWGALAMWSGPTPGSPRTISQLASEYKNSVILVAASVHYLDAITEDLNDAAEVIGPERLAIFSAGTDFHPTLEPYLVPCDARLQGTLGGALNTLNVRCVRHALAKAEDSRLHRAGLRRMFSRLLKQQPERVIHQRKALSNEEVSDFIRRSLGADAGIRPTPLLQKLRQSGLACEQARFSELFRRVGGGRNGR